MKYIVALISLLFISFFLHFYHISWGSPYFFHPDERNIASSITQLQLPHQMNPHFFAYGSFPIYIIYFLGIISNIFTNHSLLITFEKSIILGRLLSAFFSSATVFLVYFLGIRVYSKNVGLLAAGLATCSIGLIQYAHFATFEMWLTFFSVLLTYTCILYLSHPSKKLLLFITLLQGILISTKVSSFVFFFPILFTLGLSLYNHKALGIKKILLLFIHFSFVILFSLVILFLTNPFILLDNSSFLNSMTYETSVATGKLPVFYTEGFKDTIPIFYHLFFVYPFVLNPFITGLFVFSFSYIVLLLFYKKDKQLFVFILFFLCIFISQTILFVKWTRYIIPTLPYVYLMIAYTIFDIYHLANKKRLTILRYGITTVIIFISIISCFYSLYFFTEVYIKPDSRVQAYIWAKKYIPSHTHILSEVYDLGIVPFNNTFTDITLFNFYDLETNPTLSQELESEILKSTYVILPSQRITKNRLLHPSAFPNGNKFYKMIFNDKTYKKIYETPCDMLCKILYNGNPVFNLEETTSVFDRPTVYIFKKT